MNHRDSFVLIVIGTLILIGALFNVEAKDSTKSFITAYQSITAAVIAALIAICGWYYSYAFNNKVQDRRLRNDITNVARLEITKNIREYQDWLSRARGLISALGNQNDLIQKLIDLENLKDQIPVTWNASLEDYQILFPETEKVRVQLQERSIEIAQMIFDIFLSLEYASIQGDNKIGTIKDEAALFILDYMLDQISLLEDLRIFLQNKCFSEITGAKIPEREPRDISVPKIISKNGLLEIQNNLSGITTIGKMLQFTKQENNYKY